MTETDPLNQTAAATDTSMPLLKQGLYDLEITKAEVGTTDKGTEKLALSLKTTKDAESKDGETLNKGWMVYHNVGLTPTDDYPAKNIGRNISMILKAAGLPNVTPRQVIDDPQQLVGKIVRCKVAIKPEKDGYPESNKISQFVEIK